MSTRDEHLSSTQFAPPTGLPAPRWEDRPAPLEHGTKIKIRRAQGLPGRVAQTHPCMPTPTPPPAGWPTQGEVTEQGVSAFDKAADAVPKVTVTQKKLFRKPTETTETRFGMSAKSMMNSSAWDLYFGTDAKRSSKIEDQAAYNRFVQEKAKAKAKTEE